jgi:hypothetical protein
MLNGKVIPEGSTIGLDDQEALQLSKYLDEVKDSSLITDHSSLLNNKALSTKNKIRSK